MKQKPVLTIRRGCSVPTVAIGIMAAKPVASPADYIGDFRRRLPVGPKHCKCGQKIIVANETQCESCNWAAMEDAQ